ncbi:hypothetical protein CR51_25030 [Caballeronia megalochromosomata]|jgi:hypothetical protein|nr:hypothetical protein CR51_25030 [Caballeronia megalochromosomata]
MALGSAITAALMSTGFTMGAVLLAAATGTVGGISIGAIAVTVIVGTVLMAGANYIRLSDIVANGLREAGESLDKALPKDYSDAYSTSIWNFPF